MSLPEIQSLISQLPRSEQEELLRSLAGKLRGYPERIVANYRAAKPQVRSRHRSA